MPKFYELRVGDVFIPDPNVTHSKPRKIVTGTELIIKNPRGVLHGSVRACPLLLTNDRREYIYQIAGGSMIYEYIEQIVERWSLEQMIRSLKEDYGKLNPMFGDIIDRYCQELPEIYDKPAVRLYATS